ncbi:MAG: hypothetical protein ACI9U1_001654 [Porticoccaceae bacterium]|jgi:hypothetical protein
MRLLGSVSMCRGIMTWRLSLVCLLEAIRHVHLNLAESARSSPDFTGWGIQL